MAQIKSNPKILNILGVLYMLFAFSCEMLLDKLVLKFYFNGLNRTITSYKFLIKFFERNPIKGHLAV